ncbi:MAG: RNase P subunit [Nitrososphaerota archaeon]|nr:RNase P subunit [Nitrososphaerota archaeon]
MDLAIRQAKSEPELAENLAKMAWKLSTKTNARLGRWRLFFCHHCKGFIIPPVSARYRLSKRRKSLNVTCSKCHATYRLIIGSRL